MFTGVEIDNFRGFGKLSLQDLGRVNLVVGKNNTGKTSLLEAIALVADPKLFSVLPRTFRTSSEKELYSWLLKDGAAASGASISVQSTNEPRRALLTPKEQPSPGDVGSLFHEEQAGVRLSWPQMSPLGIRAVSVKHREPSSIVHDFVKAVRAPLDEQRMEALLASVDPRIKDIRLDLLPTGNLIVLNMGLTNRVPLSEAGQGVYRLVAIFSELLGTKPNLCFIDEIENGIHYTALPAVWQGIAEVAARLDIQVFATTHSRECMVAAHQAFVARSTYDLRVVQLYRIGEETSGRVLDRAHIEAAIDGDIEVR